MDQEKCYGIEKINQGNIINEMFIIYCVDRITRIL